MLHLKFAAISRLMSFCCPSHQGGLLRKPKRRDLSGSSFTGSRYLDFRLFGALSLLLLPAAQAFAALGASVTLSSGQPGTIYPGEVTQFQITLSNSNTGAAITGVNFSNLLPGSLPDGLKIAGTPTYTCTDPSGPTTSPGSGTLTATSGSQAISLANGVVPARANNADGTCTILIPVTAGTSTGNSATYNYMIDGGTVAGNDGAPVTNSGSVNQSINVRSIARPVITKGFSDPVALLGGAPVTLTITVTNSNPVPLPNFSVTDNFPTVGGNAVIKVAAAPAATSTCTAGGTPAAFSPLAGGVSVAASGGTIAANGSCTISVAVEANSTNGTFDTGLQTNTINGATDFSNDFGITAANATAQIRARSPLSVAKAFASATLAGGQSSSFTITLTNRSSSALTNVAFTDDPIDGVLPAGPGHPAYGLSVTGQSTTCGGSVGATAGNTGVSLSGGTVPANGSCTVTVNFTANVQTAGVPISYTNTLPEGAVTVATPGIVSQTASASVLVADDLRVQKSATPTSVAPGNPVQFTVTVENYSTSPISNVVVTDTFSHGLTFLTGLINGKNYTPTMTGLGCVGLTTASATGAPAPQLTIGTLPGRSSATVPGACSITFYAMAPPGAANGASISNTLLPGSVCYNAGANCNGGPSQTTGGTVNTSVLSLDKSFSLSSPRPEGTVTRMTFTITNLSANELTGVSISDPLPTAVGGGQMRVANPANAASSCGTPTITAVPNSTSVTMNGGTVPGRSNNGTGANGTCTLQVDVVGGAGTYSNTANVSGTQTYANGNTNPVGPVSDTTGFTYSSVLAASKGFSPANVSSGGRSTVTVRLTNTGAVALTNVAVTDPLPSGMVLANPPNAYSTCSGSTVFNAVSGASTVGMTGAAIAGNSNCDFLFDVVATGASNWTNTIPAGNITADGGISNQSPVAGTLNFNAPNSPSVSKATNPSTLTFPGQISQLTITLTNGTQKTTNVRLTDYFTNDGTAGSTANGMVIAASPAAATTCPGGIVAATPGGKSVSLTGATIEANSSCTMTVNVTSNSVGGITNTIPAGALQNDQGLTNSGQATTSLTTQTNVGLVKNFTPNVVKPGERSRLRITFYNPTSQPVVNLGVTDTLPAGVTVPSGANPQTTCSGATMSSPATNQVQVSGASIAAAAGGVTASCYAEIDVAVAAQGDYVNTIPANSVTATSNGTPVTNSEPTSDTLRAKAPLAVRKAIASRTLDAGNPAGFTTGSASRTPGNAATMTIRIENPNAVALTAAAFTDSLPAGLVVAPTPNAATTCVGGSVITAASATSVRLTGATIPANGFCTVSVDLLSNSPGTYVNTIPSGGVTTFEGVKNEEPTSAELIVSVPPSVSKQFSPVVIPPGRISKLTIFLVNDNPAATTLTSALVDTLPTAPGNIVVAPAPNVVTNCPGAVTATAGGGTVTYANGAAIPAGGCTITVDVTGLAAGVHNNNIPAGALQTTLGNNQQPANASLTVSTLGYISGKVFQDNNAVPNGTFQPGTDAPLSGVGIELRSGTSCSGPLVSAAGLANPALTDALGNYSFASLPAGTYTVCEPVQPSGTTNGKTTAGGITSINGSTGTAGVASNPTAGSSRIASIVLNSTGSGEVSGSSDNNFAEIVPSSISGRVFHDQNNNGIQNGSDAGIAGVAVNLSGYHYGPDGVNNGGAGDDVAVNQATSTDASGNYSFTGLLPGVYTVTEPTQPAGTANGQTVPGAVPNNGTAGTATGPAVAPSRISGIVLPPDTASVNNNFAEIPNGRSLSGRIFLDYDNSGTINDNDHGIAGQLVNLSGIDINNNPFNATATTAADGTYSFTGVPEGTYTVTQPAQPAGTTNGRTLPGSTGGTATPVATTPSAISGVNLTGANMVSANNDFAEIPGASPDLAVTKTHTPTNFAAAGNTGYFTITPKNVGLVPTTGVVTIVDTLPAGMTLAATPTGAGWSCNGAAGATVATCTSNNAIGPRGQGNPITLRVAVAAGLSGQVLTNTVAVSGGSEPPGFEGNNTATDPVVISIAAALQGHVWLDRSHTRRFADSLSVPQPGWAVELLLNGVQVAGTTTNAAGAYSFGGLAPGPGYQVRFRHPLTGQIYGNAVPNEDAKKYVSGVMDSDNNPAGAVTTDGTLQNLTLKPGETTVQQSLPIDPAGVVYDAVTRNPVGGADITITGPTGFDPAVHLVGGNGRVTTAEDGMYQFLLMSTAPSGTYHLRVTNYPTGYRRPPEAEISPSEMIRSCDNTLSVANVPNPALVQTSSAAPTVNVPAHASAACPGSTASFGPGNQGSTQYYMSFNITTSGLGASANVVNNHIPLDPILTGAIVMTKSSPLVNVSRGDLVPYTVTAKNILSSRLSSINVVDRIPAGFRYRKGSATYNGVAIEPTVVGRDLVWPNQTFAGGESKTWKMLLVVGTGVGEGEYVNQAWSLSTVTNTQISNLATAAVRVVPDPTFDCSDIIGKVFDDQNANGYQDDGEPGIANVRVVTARGLLVTTDADGRFHVACAAIPQADRGSNFVMKLDERTLPTGYRITTENPRDVRVTRGKMVKLNFGATIHRVVRLELSGQAFEKDGTQLSAAWMKQLEALPDKLKDQPSVLRIAYRVGSEGTGLAKSRTDYVAEKVKQLWQSAAKERSGKEEVRNPLVVEIELEGAK